jgi:hypothetical protein
MWTEWLVRVATLAIGVKFAIEMMQIAVLTLPTQIDSRDFIHALAQLGTELSTFSLVPFFVFLLAVGAAALISRAVPVWLAWFTVASARSTHSRWRSASPAPQDRSGRPWWASESSGF